MPMRFTPRLCAAALATLIPALVPALVPALGTAIGAARAADGDALVPALSFSEPVNAVATTTDGTTFVGFPRLTGEPGVKVAKMVDGKPVPFPDADWNGWREGDDPSHAFVRLNALRIGPDGKLWVVDVGAPAFDKPVVPGGTKILVFEPATGALIRSYVLTDKVLAPKSYIDDIRFSGRRAVITDAGVPGLILLDLDTGAQRRVLDHAASTTDQRPMRAEGRLLTGPDGQPTKIHADQQEMSPDGKTLYFMPCSGPLYRVDTAALFDEGLDEAALERRVSLFADVPTTGGTAMAASGTIYISDTDRSRVFKIAPSGQTETVVADPRLAWVDAMWIDRAGTLWMPAPQLDRTPPMDGGKTETVPPFVVYTLKTGETPPANDHP